MIKDTPEGTTHSYEDGCNPPHEYPTPKTIDDVVRDILLKSAAVDGGAVATKYHIQIVDALTTLLHTAIAEIEAGKRKFAADADRETHGAYMIKGRNTAFAEATAILRRLLDAPVCDGECNHDFCEGKRRRQLRLSNRAAALIGRDCIGRKGEPM